MEAVEIQIGVKQIYFLNVRAEDNLLYTSEKDKND